MSILWSLCRRGSACSIISVLAIGLCAVRPARAETAGSISGTVTDAGGAVVARAIVTATQTATAFKLTTTTDSKGTYSLPRLPVGTYDIQIDANGFRPYRRTGVTVDADSALIIDATLEVGGRTETIVVSDTAVHAETADTQLGQVISGSNTTSVPLTGRSFTDLLALQPGVAPATSITGTSVVAAGASTFSTAGDLNPGTLAINGQREYANGFRVNSADSNERFMMGAAIIPNLDSIAEFRILTSNFDAQYGNYGGGQVDVVTKSGTNQFHGDAFEFLRNTDLDARNYFSASRAVFQQNQFGGTFGGPLVRKKIFFFSDYQGTRLKQGVDTPTTQVPSMLDRSGNLSDIANQLTGTVTGNFWASQLSQQLGYPVTAGEPYYTAGCTSSSQCVLPNAMIPTTAWSAPAKNLLQYIPEPNTGPFSFQTSSSNQTLRDDKGAMRVDAETRLGLISAYYFADDYVLNNPYPTQQGGATVPGFNGLNLGRAQLVTVGDTKTFGPRTLNEFHFSFVRDGNNLGSPVGGVGPTLASQGFLTPSGQPSILPQRPGIEGVENIVFNSFVMGVDLTGLNQKDNNFEILDNFSRVIGSHTLSVGGEMLFNEVNAVADVQSNGGFFFFGTETGVDFADFLLGISSRYIQGDARPFFMRNRYGALYAQDSWRLTPRLTVNYGLRWDVVMPWYEKYNQLQTLVAGQQSIVYPGAPTGLVFPADPSVARSLAPTRWNNFSPRLGLAYSPGEHEGFLGKILGNPGQTSIRAGVGRFFTAIEGASAGVMAGDAPYGSTYESPQSPLFKDPFITASNGFDNGQRFPLHFPPFGVTASNPDNAVNWAPFLPISGLPAFNHDGVSPYAEQYSLTIDRQFGADTLLSLGYVGSQGHHLVALVEANPSNPAACLSVSEPSQVAPNTPTCGPFSETGTFTTAAGQSVVVRQPFGANFGSVDSISTIGNSNFNAFELTLRHTGKYGQFLAGYTLAHSFDISSSLSEQLDPYNYHATYAPSSFDIRNNFVVSYQAELPFARLFQAHNRLTDGWTVTGITRFSSGFPVTFYNDEDTSLYGTQPDGVNPYGVDLPEYTPGPLELNSNPRNGKSYFNASLFCVPGDAGCSAGLGVLGNTPRRFFYGPGINNFDIALLKDTRITESKSIQFRIETFNTFNHAQFYGPASVQGDISSSDFGNVVSAASPRLVQAGLKFLF
ncbi:MAG TPA: TonB-dependent receptor [Candidatus Acidoferrum sp.]|nr:TonB-dependent receptor [Candidatus Acidoferrum sp.]